MEELAVSRLLLTSLEGIRGITELIMALILKRPLEYVSIKGDGHPVIVMPGLATNDQAIHYLRSFLTNVGYKTYSWGQGFNFGPRHGLDNMLEKLQERLTDVYNENNQKKVTLIGWSLGGLYVRELAKLNPEMVRCVITLGTPFRPGLTARPITFLYEFFSGDKSSEDPEMWERLGQKPPMPFTSIYSKSDGVVQWEASIDVVSDISENVEVPLSSHLGLITNPFVMRVIADRLSQPEGCWIPFKDST